MGKTKRNRNKPGKTKSFSTVLKKNAKQKQSIENIDDSHIYFSKQDQTIKSMISLLQSAAEEERMSGLQTLATIFQNPSEVEEVLKHNVVKVAGPLLVDPSTSVRNMAAGSLRNLSACGDPAICDILLEQDIMTPLTALLDKYVSDWTPHKKMKEKHDEITDTFIQAVHLLWNLCESNNLAVKYFNERKIARILLKCLDFNVYGKEVAIVTAQCFNTVTEDNLDIISELQDFKEIFFKILRIDEKGISFSLLKALVCGILINIEDKNLQNIEEIIAILNNVLLEDHRSILNALSSKFPLSKDEEFTNETLEDTKDAETLLEAQQLAIEIITNLCSEDDNDEEEMEVDSVSSDEPMSDEECYPSNELYSTKKLAVNLLPQVFTSFVNVDFLERLRNKANPVAVNVMEILKNCEHGKHICKIVTALQSRLYLCINNIVLAMDSDVKRNVDYLHSVWMDIVRQFIVHRDSEDTELLESATSSVRSIVQRLQEERNEIFSNITEHILQVMFESKNHCADGGVQINIIRSIGSIGLILTNNGKTNLVKVIGRFLLDSTAKETDLWILAETLDTVMDLFGEDETDSIAAEIGLVEKLQTQLPNIKSKVRQHKKDVPSERQVVVETVNTNLSRFIKYKHKRTANLSINSNGKSH